MQEPSLVFMVAEANLLYQQNNAIPFNEYTVYTPRPNYCEWIPEKCELLTCIYISYWTDNRRTDKVTLTVSVL